VRDRIAPTLPRPAKAGRDCRRPPPVAAARAPAATRAAAAAAGQAVISPSLPQLLSEVVARGPFANTSNDRTFVRPISAIAAPLVQVYGCRERKSGPLPLSAETFLLGSSRSGTRVTTGSDGFLGWTTLHEPLETI